VQGFVQESFGVFEHHIFLTLPAGFLGHEFAAHSFRQHAGGVIIVNPERLEETGVGQRFQRLPRAGKA
jgi:hypothetical protein